MQSTRNVLIFPAGTECGLEIFAALHSCRQVRLFAAGGGDGDHARLLYPEYHRIPHVEEPGWLDHLIELCRRLGIDYILPAHDDVVLATMRAAGKIPARIIASPLATCEIARSKRATYRHFSGKLRVPALYESAAQVDRFPVFVKPDRGQGAQGAVRVADPASLDHALRGLADALICEDLPGEEFTIDCFSHRKQGLLFVGARRRLRLRNGIAVHTHTVTLPQARAIAEVIASELEFHGAWFFQVKRAADGALCLLELAPRIAGSMAAHRVRGVNFPLLSIYEAEGLPLILMPDDTEVELDRALANRYRHRIAFSAAYIDLDRTLLTRGKLNADLLCLVFQCIEANKPVHLVTRCRSELDARLKRYRLAGLFDRIIQLEAHECISDHIVEPDAILIDDSFSERRKVALRRGIRTFDCSMVEMLIRQAASLETADE